MTLSCHYRLTTYSDNQELLLEETIQTSIIEALSNKSPNEAYAYIKGMSECLAIIEDTVQRSERTVEPEETDPLYIYTWNHVLNELSTTVLDELRKGINKVIKTMEEQ